MTADLAAFLLDRTAEDEAAARAATQGPWYADVSDDEDAEGGNVRTTADDYPVATSYDVDACARADATHIARWDPARVLAECEARRAIVEEHGRYDSPHGHPGPWCRMCQSPGGWGTGRVADSGQRFPCRTLRLLALPYAGHPEFRSEWGAE